MKSLLVLVLLAVAASALPIPSEELEILKQRAEHLEKALVDLEKAKIQFQGEKTEEEGGDRGAIQEVLEKIAQLERVFSLELEAVRRKIAELEGVVEITTEIPSTDDYLKSSEESEESEEKRVEEEVTTIETPTTPAWVFEEEEQKAQQIEEATNEPLSEKTELDTSEEKAKIQAEKVQELLQAAAVYKKAVYDLTINAILSYIPEEYKDFLGNVRVRDQPLLFLALHAISLHISNNYDEDEIKKIGAIATELTAADPELHVFIYKLQEFLVQQRAKWESLKESTKDRIKELIGSDHQAFSPSNAQEVLEKLDSIIAFEDDKDTQADLISHWPNLENYFNSDYLKSQIQLLRLARKSLVEYIARDGPNQEIDATEATIIEEVEKTPVEDLEGLLEEAARL